MVKIVDLFYVQAFSYLALTCFPSRCREETPFTWKTLHWEFYTVHWRKGWEQASVTSKTAPYRINTAIHIALYIILVLVGLKIMKTIHQCKTWSPVQLSGLLIDWEREICFTFTVTGYPMVI